jgi:uncharacterized protein YegP (UPF0339 family)
MANSDKHYCSNRNAIDAIDTVKANAKNKQKSLIKDSKEN